MYWSLRPPQVELSITLVLCFRNNRHRVLGCTVDFITPGVDDRLAVDVVDEGHQAILESCLEVTRMWRNSERASLEDQPSMRLSHEPWVGVNAKVKRPIGCAASQVVVSHETWAEWLSRMISMAVSAG